MEEEFRKEDFGIMVNLVEYERFKKLEEDNKSLKEENETLKDKIEFLTQCLDDRDKSIALMQKQEYPFGPVKTISEPTNGR